MFWLTLGFFQAVIKSRAIVTSVCFNAYKDLGDHDIVYSFLACKADLNIFRLLSRSCAVWTQ